jgi:TonB family protein
LDIPDNTEGIVYSSFVIEKDGSVTNVKIVKSGHPSFSAEAIRVIKKMPNWTPGKKEGELVRTKHFLRLVFSIRDLD